MITRAVKIDTTTPGTYTETHTEQTCPICKQDVKMWLHMWVKMDGKITHDYCVRKAGLR